MAEGTYLENGVYLPYISETPWGNQVNQNFVILSNAYDNIKIEFNEELSNKLDKDSGVTQTINANVIVNGSWQFRDNITGTITYAITANNATLADSALNANHADTASNAEHADSADTSAFAVSAENAVNADNAERAETAGSADSAERDALGNVIHTTYIKRSDYSNENEGLIFNHILDTDMHTSRDEKNAIQNNFTRLSNDIDTANENITSNANDISDLRNDIGNLSSQYLTLNTPQTVTGAKTFTSPITGSLTGNATTADRFSSAKTIKLTGDVTGTASGTSGWNITTEVAGIDASKITSGVIDIARIPQSALERLVTVADRNSRFALTTANVQVGDMVKQMDTGNAYIVVDDANLDNDDGYMAITAGSAASVPWSGITDKPLSYTPSSHTHYKAEIADFPTLATVATTGNYNDLLNVPPTASVNNGTLTIKRNNANVATFTANQSSNVTANISVPIKLSDLTNDSGFITSQQIDGLYVSVSDTQTISGNKTFTNTITGSISGNAATADKFSSSKTVKLTGDVTGSASSQDSWSIATTLKNSGVTAGSYGNSSVSIQSGTFKIPYVSVNAKGLVTNVSETTVTIPEVDSVDLSLYPYKLNTVNSNGFGRWEYRNLEDTETYPDGFNGETASGIYHVNFTPSTAGAPVVGTTHKDGILVVHGMSSVTGVSSYSRAFQVFYSIGNVSTAMQMFVRRGAYYSSAWHWDSEWTEITYKHPETSGNRHIPSGGSSGQYLKWSADGTAVWANIPDDSDSKVTNTLNTTAKAYVTGTVSSSTNTGTQIFDTGVYLDTTAGQLTAGSVKVTNSSSQGIKLGNYTVYIE